MGANRAAMAVLSRSSPEPLYRQLAQPSRERDPQRPAEAGRSAGVRGASGPARSQVSRITLRQAVAELVRKQLLVRKQGKGTFVTAPAVRHDLRRSHGLLGSLFSQARGRERAPAAVRAARPARRDRGAVEPRVRAEPALRARSAVPDRRPAGGSGAGLAGPEVGDAAARHGQAHLDRGHDARRSAS